jgi:hypothetical protein
MATNKRNQSHLEKHLIQLHDCYTFPRAHPPPATENHIQRSHHFSFLIGLALEKSLGPEYIGVLSKDSLVVRQGYRVMSDACASRDKFAVECVA